MLVYIFLQIEWMCICVAFLTANLFIFVIHSLFVPNNRGGMYTHARHFDNHTQITYGCQQQSDDILTKFTWSWFFQKFIQSLTDGQTNQSTQLAVPRTAFSLVKCVIGGGHIIRGERRPSATCDVTETCANPQPTAWELALQSKNSNAWCCNQSQLSTTVASREGIKLDRRRVVRQSSSYRQI